MIELSAALLASADPPLTHARIFYQTYTFDLTDASVTASTQTSTGPKDSPLRPDTAEYWEPSALPATWLLDLGQSRSIDYVAIAGHTLGSDSARVQIDAGTDTDLDARMILPGASGNYASTPDSAAVSITGDIDVRVKLSLDDWTPPDVNLVIAKDDTSAQRSWVFYVGTDGKLVLVVYNPSQSAGTSTVATGIADGAVKFVRFTFNISTGDMKFYTSDDGVVWTQLGTTVAAASGAIADTTVQIGIGSRSAGDNIPLKGKIYYAELRNGIDGPVVAAFDPYDWLGGSTFVSSETGETWTINSSGSPSVGMVNYRLGNRNDPTDDSPIVFMDVARSIRYVRLTVTGSTEPRIAVIYAGTSLAMEREVNGSGFAPITLSRETVLHRSLSRGGQLLGQGFRRNGVQGSASFRHLDPDWYRENFDPFVEHARHYPYFFAWWPEEYPEEVAFVWTAEDIAPSYMGIREFMQVAWKMQGIGLG